MRHLTAILAATAVLFASHTATLSSALACAGLISSNGAVNLGRTTTLAAHHDGVEHYVTGVQVRRWRWPVRDPDPLRFRPDGDRVSLLPLRT